MVVRGRRCSDPSLRLVDRHGVRELQAIKKEVQGMMTRP